MDASQNEKQLMHAGSDNCTFVLLKFLQGNTSQAYSLVLLWLLFYLFCSSIVINTVIVTARNFEP